MIAKRLEKGDTIGVVSPSNPVHSLEDEGFVKGIKNLEEKDFKIAVGKNVCSKDPKLRAKDVNDFFNDEKIDAIFSSKGGDTVQDTLPFIDFEIIKSNPKIFVGFSDVTAYLNAIYAKTGLITFQGNDIREGFGLQINDYSLAEFERTLVRGEKGEIPANKNRETIIPGKTEGKMLGGNLRCLLKLKDTNMWPDFNKSILMIEAFHLAPEECRKRFSELKEKKVFEKISGVIIGYIYGMQFENPEGEQMEKIILEYVKEKPILKCNDFGHLTQNATLPIGAKVRVDATNKKIEIIEDFVK